MNLIENKHNIKSNQLQLQHNNKLNDNNKLNNNNNQLSLALRTLQRATKKSKAFQIQHLIRKIKSSKLPKPNSSRKELDPVALNADLLLLKSINAEELAKKYLYLRLKRQSSEFIHDSLFNHLQNSSELISFDRIENIICSQKSLADLINQIVSKLSLHLTQSTPQTSNQQTKSTHSIPSSIKSQNPILPSKTQHQQSSDHEDLSGDELDQAVARELKALDTTSHHTYDHDQQSDSSDHHSLSPSSNLLVHLPKSSNNLKTKSLSSHRTNYDSGNSKTSTFLPALNVGFTLGDLSDQSDLEDLNDPFLDKMERERERKNRRGQRARRSIWEKKYGKSAKHLIKLNQKNQSKSNDHQSITSTLAKNKRNDIDFNPSDFDDNHNSKRLKKNLHHSNDQSVISGTNLEPISTNKDKSKLAQPLHPSWVAKQNLLHAASIIKPTGKKIIFT